MTEAAGGTDKGSPSATATPRLRYGVNRDLLEIAAIHRESISAHCRGEYTDVQVEAWVGNLGPEFYARVLREGCVIVAEIAETIVGFASVRLREGLVEAVYVRPGWTGRGVGRALLDRIEDIARQHGLLALELCSSLNAVGFYLGLGYRVACDHKLKITDSVDLDCRTMMKLLVPNPADMIPEEAP